MRGERGGTTSRRVVFEGLALIQVQWQRRRLYDDEEHLGDRGACNFLARTCTPLPSIHRRSMHARNLRHSPPFEPDRAAVLPRDQFVFGRAIAVMRLR